MYNLLTARIYDDVSELVQIIKMKGKTKRAERNIFNLILPRFPYHV